MTHNDTVKQDDESACIKELCELLRKQQVLSLVREENGAQVCDVVPDEVAAHAADIIEELWNRLDKQYMQGVAKGMELKADELAYEAIKKA